MYLLQMISTALSYLFFHIQLFHYIAQVLQQKHNSRKMLIWTYLLNYIIFIFCSIGSFHLIVNWLIFLVLLYVEIHFLYHISKRKSALLSLLGGLLGLALNIFFRSLFAILLSVPLSVFDNNGATDNIKVYPVLAGFAMAGVCFWLAKRHYPAKKIFLIFSDSKNLLFLLSLLSAMYLYLSLNLIVYYVGENSPVVKLWSMKSSIFVMVGEYLAVTLSYKMAQVKVYRQENERAKQILEEEKEREQELRKIAVLDTLTGCANQSEALKYLHNTMDTEFLLVFVDLNCLKQVNDQYGHKMGDCYLQSVCEILQSNVQKNVPIYRYGGDEFLLIYRGTTLEEVEKRMENVQEILHQREHSVPFSMSISYGIVENHLSESVDELIHKADMAMYRMKQKMKKERNSSNISDSIE